MVRSIKKPVYMFTLMSSVALLSGCLEDMGTTRFTSKPTAIPVGASFQDQNMGEMLGGNLVITPASDGQTDQDKWTFDTYVAKWAIDGVVIPSDMFSRPNTIGRVDRTQQPLVLPIREVPPNGANSIVIFTANALGLADQGFSIPFENIQIDPRVPNAKVLPSSVQFGQSYGGRTGNNQGDNDYTVRSSGVLSFFKPNPYQVCTFGCTTVTDTEKEFTKYNVYYAGSDGCPLKGPAIASIPKNADGFYVVGFSYQGKVVAPPIDATSFAIIPANQYGEAYSLNCAYAHTTSNINIISPSNYPHYTAQDAVLTADSDSTDTLTATLTIKKSLDERDLAPGYFLLWGYKGVYSAERLQFYRNNGGDHVYEFNRWQPKASNGQPISLDNINLYVSTGYEYLGGDRGITLDMKTKNKVGNWYLINELAMMADSTSDQCITAVNKDADIKKTKCDKYDEAQRFEVEYAGDASNDDIHYIKSVKYPGYCIYRPDDSQAPNWKLKSCDNSWNVRVEIKANNSTAKDRMKKKIAVNHGVGWTCLAHYTVTDALSSPWGNCGVSTSEIFWKFLKVGRDTDYGYFND